MQAPRAAGECGRRLLESIRASAFLEEATAAGDADRALQIIHEVSCNLMNLMSLGPSSQGGAAGGKAVLADKAAPADEVPGPGCLGVGRGSWLVIRQVFLTWD